MPSFQWGTTIDGHVYMMMPPNIPQFYEDVLSFFFGV